VLASYARSRQIERSALNRLGVERRELNDEEYERIIELAGLGEARAQLRRDFALLDEDQRHVLRLRVVEQRPYPDVAHALGVSEQTARARVSRALRALRTAQRAGHPGHDSRG
jgi:RNA polymerase sigma-70 factor (ECF subfamily)